jgi:signal transduction histidine kinase
LKLGTKLTVYLSLIIVAVLSVHGYLTIRSRRELLIRKTKVEVMSVGHTLEISLERTWLPSEKASIQSLIDAVDKYEHTLGVIVSHEGTDLVFQSRSLEGDIEPFLGAAKKAIRDGLPQEQFGEYKKVPVFSYAIPLRDRSGRTIGGLLVLQHTAFLEEDIRKARAEIAVTLLVLIGATVALTLLGTRKWVTQPISALVERARAMAKGELETRIEIKGRDELSELGKAFNQMAVGLMEAQGGIIREAETRLNLERELRQSEKLAAIGQITSGLAHEIGTPLNVISGRAELMKRRLDDPEGIRKNLDLIIRQTEKIARYIQQILGFVRKKKPEIRLLPVRSLLETTLEILDPQIRRQGVDVRRQFHEGLPPVAGDADQLQQVLLNILLNGVQAMPEGGTLTVSAASVWTVKEGLGGDRRNYVEIAIRDTGIGMDRDAAGRVFDAFFTTKDQDKGTGLGLTISLGIVQEHEGWIDVESEMGRGSEFRIYLPSCPEALSPGPALAGKRIGEETA